ncbi:MULTISPECIES: TetR family transcriptional regulator [unclassified Ketobacter]|uniref:TetR family transcriptional regulator n=1 Tax=unclassified Ketobacter TaxID=2639109 RepID=UPI0025BC82BA|nr:MULTISPECIES: TetR family transcriptional regulator [unclassified Ketobacter]
MPPASQKSSRSDRKEATRRRILAAAMQLVEEGRSPDALGLREVARAAGMAAPSLYNHFTDMDELGLALVDECLLRMRAVARRARRAMVSQDVEPALKTLLGEFLLAVSRFEPVLRLLIVQWLNPNPEYRRLIRRELSMMRREMANDMRDAAQLKGMGEVGFDVESDAIFSLLITFVLNALDISLEKREQRLAILERQVMMVVLGSRALRA